jgi:nucleotide-binding universal stress UspA family protein
MSRVRTVLHASDFSKQSNRAFAQALDMAKSHRARLTILTVIVPAVPIVPEQTLYLSMWKDIEAEAARFARQRLTRLAARARKAGVPTTILLGEGDPAREIVRVARSIRANLLVIGTHGRTGWSKLMLGSVAQRVVATAPCPVLSVRSV